MPYSYATLFILLVGVLLFALFPFQNQTMLSRAQETIQQTFTCPTQEGKQTIQMFPCTVDTLLYLAPSGSPSQFCVGGPCPTENPNPPTPAPPAKTTPTPNAPSPNPISASPSAPAPASPCGVLPTKPTTIPADIKKAIADTFCVNLNDFNAEQLNWAWNFFWKTSNTKLASLVKGTNVFMKPTLDGGAVGLTYSTPCPNKLELASSALNSQAEFDHIFGHELGHVLSFCNDRATIKYNEHRNALAEEGWVTNYWENCPSQPDPIEDFAESIAYYLNPTAKAVPLCATSKPRQNPFFELQPVKALHLNNFVIPVLQ